MRELPPITMHGKLRMHCPGCWQHWYVMPALGQWVATCTKCEVYIDFCDPEHCPKPGSTIGIMVPRS